MTLVAQRMVAPGAEEFLRPTLPGPWLPPERTFAPLRRRRPANMRVERARTVGFGLEHEFKDASVVSVQRFFQSVDDQLITLFGLNLPGGPDSAGHYFVASAGARRCGRLGLPREQLANSRVQGRDRLQHHPHAVAGSAATSSAAADGAPAAWRPQRGSPRHHDVGRDRHS